MLFNNTAEYATEWRYITRFTRHS